MSFKLEIRLDRPDGVYLYGDTISGVVTIHDPDGGRGKISLVREWRAHGRGSGDFGSRAEEVLTQQWGAGSSEIPFSFTLPDGPFTYRGTNTNLDWYVRAETGGIIKTRAETDFIYGAVPNMPSVDFGPSYKAPTPITPQTIGSMGISPAAGIGCAGALLGFVGLITFLVQPPLIVAIFMIGVFAVGAAVLLYNIFRNRLAQQKLGEINLEIAPLLVQPNQTVRVHFSTTIQAELELEKIEAKLVQNEFYATGSGTDRTTHTVPVFTQPVLVSSQKSLRAGEKLEFDVEFFIPDGAAHTFMANDNRVLWQIIITLPLKGWSDWQHTQDITVKP